LANGLREQARATVGSETIFDAKEQETLNAAASILSGFKDKVQHAKEKAARAEKQRERNIELSTHKAKAVLEPLVNALPFREKVILVLQGDGWPYRNYVRLHETAEIGIDKLNNEVEIALRGWVSDQSRSMGFDENSSFMPQPVNVDQANKCIQRGLKGYAPINTAEIDKLMARIAELEAIAQADNVEMLKPGGRR